MRPIAALGIVGTTGEHEQRYENSKPGKASLFSLNDPDGRRSSAGIPQPDLTFPLL
jgi:hypothetical protein